MDYAVNTSQVIASNEASDPPGDVKFTFNLDGVVLEQNETFSLELVSTDSNQLPRGDFVYFLNTLNLTIIDNDRKYCMHCSYIRVFTEFYDKC